MQNLHLTPTLAGHVAPPDAAGNGYIDNRGEIHFPIKFLEPSDFLSTIEMITKNTWMMHRFREIFIRQRLRFAEDRVMRGTMHGTWTEMHHPPYSLGAGGRGRGERGGGSGPGSWNLGGRALLGGRRGRVTTVVDEGSRGPPPTSAGRGTPPQGGGRGPPPTSGGRGPPPGTGSSPRVVKPKLPSAYQWIVEVVESGSLESKDQEVLEINFRNLKQDQDGSQVVGHVVGKTPVVTDWENLDVFIGSGGTQGEITGENRALMNVTSQVGHKTLQLLIDTGAACNVIHLGTLTKIEEGYQEIIRILQRIGSGLVDTIGTANLQLEVGRVHRDVVFDVLPRTGRTILGKTDIGQLGFLVDPGKHRMLHLESRTVVPCYPLVTKATRKKTTSVMSTDSCEADHQADAAGQMNQGAVVLQQETDLTPSEKKVVQVDGGSSVEKGYLGVLCSDDVGFLSQGLYIPLQAVATVSGQVNHRVVLENIGQDTIRVRAGTVLGFIRELGSVSQVLQENQAQSGIMGLP